MLKLAKYLKPFSGYVALTILFMLGQAFSEITLPTLMSDVVNKGMVAGDTAQIIRYGGIMLAATLVSAVCAVLGGLFSAIVATGAGRDLRGAVFRKATAFSLYEYDKFGAASLITRTTNDIVQIQQSLVMILRFMIYAPLMCIGGLTMAVSRDKGLTLILIVAIPIIVSLMAVVAKYAMPLFRTMQKKIDRLNLVAREGLTGVRVIRAFNRQKYERERFDEASVDLMRNSIRVNRIMSGLMPAIMLIMNLTTVSVIWFGGLRVDAGKTDLGGMMAFSQYAMMIMFSFVMVSMLFIMLPRAAVSAERIDEVLSEAPPETGDERAEAVKRADEAVDLRGVVEFHNVSFRYKGAERAALSSISFTAEPGKTVAVIGGTGSGKSTLVSLIPRFYEATEGEILLGGVNISSIDKGALRAKIGFVPQKAVLFSDTIAGNIRYGNESATDDEVRRAAEIAQAAGFIEKLGGYDYGISQGGTNVSGGQRQRLSIARAIVRKPAVYVLDDAFSALDMKTDAELRRALKEETSNATVIIVAQRLSSVMDADTIIVLDAGEMVGSGTHAELMENCAVYRDIANSQGRG